MGTLTKSLSLAINKTGAPRLRDNLFNLSALIANDGQMDLQLPIGSKQSKRELLQGIPAESSFPGQRDYSRMIYKFLMFSNIETSRGRFSRRRKRAVNSPI